MLQRGEKLSMPQSRPMSLVGRRCHELRVRDGGLTWRVIYRLDEDAVVILHVFSKKTQRTPQTVIESCKALLSRYDAL